MVRLTWLLCGWVSLHYCILTSPVDEILKVEIKQRDDKIADLSNKLSKECDIRARTEKERNKLSTKLVKPADQSCMVFLSVVSHARFLPCLESNRTDFNRIQITG